MIIDLSVIINNETKTYFGDPKVNLKQIASLSKDGFNNYELSINMHASTHIDGPMHMDDTKKYISNYGLDRFYGQARLVKQGEPYEYKGESIVCMIRNDVPLSHAFVNQLIKHKIKMIVVDSESIEDAPYELHKKLFSHSIMIVENAVNLALLKPYKQFMIYAMPLKVEADSSPVRLFAVV